MISENSVQSLARSLAQDTLYGRALSEVAARTYITARSKWGLGWQRLGRDLREAEVHRATMSTILGFTPNSYDLEGVQEYSRLVLNLLHELEELETL